MKSTAKRTREIKTDSSKGKMLENIISLGRASCSLLSVQDLSIILTVTSASPVQIIIKFYSRIITIRSHADLQNNISIWNGWSSVGLALVFCIHRVTNAFSINQFSLQLLIIFFIIMNLTKTLSSKQPNCPIVSISW